MSNDSPKIINLTYTEFIRLLIWCVIAGTLFLLKYLFPNNEFVMTYFKGVYGFIVMVAFFIFVWRVEVFIAKKKKIFRTSISK